MMRASRLAVVAGLLAVSVSACGTPRAGAAATVGDERITTSQLDAVVQRSLADPSAEQTVGADKPAFERQVLARLISHAILERAAKATGVTVDGATVDAAFDTFSQQLGGEAQLKAEALKAGIAPQDLRGAITDAALRDAIGDKLTASIVIPEAVLAQAYQANIAQYDRVHSAHILVATLAEAQQLLARVKADPSSFGALAAQFSGDTSNKANGGDLGFQGRGALEKPFEDAIFAAKPGSFVIAHTSFGYHVIHVIARQTVTLAQATNDLRRTLLSQQRSDALTALLDTTIKAAHVHVNPRFGTWDPSTEGVIESVLCPNSAISSPSPRPDSSGGAAPTPTESPAC